MAGQQQTGSGGVRIAILILATITTGLTAGMFADWSNAIMPGLSNVDDRTLVTTFQALDAAIVSPFFIGVAFLGAPLLIALSVALHLRPAHRPVLWWTGAALVFYLLMFVITFGVHEPLNLELRTAQGLNNDADFAAARAQLDEATWTAWNTVRTLASTIAFGCLTWALVIHRTTGQTMNQTQR